MAAATATCLPGCTEPYIAFFGQAIRQADANREPPGLPRTLSLRIETPHQKNGCML